jgi:hypothetical protein
MTMPSRWTGGWCSPAPGLLDGVERLEPRKELLGLRGSREGRAGRPDAFSGSQPGVSSRLLGSGERLLLQPERPPPPPALWQRESRRIAVARCGQRQRDCLIRCRIIRAYVHVQWVGSQYKPQRGHVPRGSPEYTGQGATAPGKYREGAREQQTSCFTAGCVLGPPSGVSPCSLYPPARPSTPPREGGDMGTIPRSHCVVELAP